jgi:hypothetical protein
VHVSGRPSGPPSSGPYPYEKDDAFEFTWGDGEYRNEVTIAGHYFAEGYTVGFDELTAESQGEEFCNLTIDTDWHEVRTTRNGESPFTVAGSGGYGDDFLDCLFGHKIYVYATYHWRNTPNPEVNDDSGDLACYDFNSLVNR